MSKIICQHPQCNILIDYRDKYCKIHKENEFKKLFNLLLEIPSPINFRIAMVFHHLKLKSIADLKKLSENELISQYSFGLRCYEELTKILKKHKIKLRML